MVAVGLHCHWLNGIDYLGSSCKIPSSSKYTLPVALAIVLSGQYEDDLDNSEAVVYTGQGGHDLLGNKKQVKDQVMGSGNLALKPLRRSPRLSGNAEQWQYNYLLDCCQTPLRRSPRFSDKARQSQSASNDNSMLQALPVRVIRGHKCAQSYCGKVYTYDGLYKVVQYWAEKGVSGFTVFKYRLQRLGGQPELTTTQVTFAGGRGKASVLAELPGLVSKDICEGQEDVCIPATNMFDVPRVAPAGFTYYKSIQLAEGLSLPPSAPGCNCKGTCTNPKTCACARLNGTDFPYVRRDGGRLIEAKDVVYECGPNCGCGPGCVNKTSQRGLRYRLEVFQTENKGWAVRSWDPIPSGAPVCEYTGVLRRTDDVDNVSENDYIFEIDCWHTMNEIGGRERRFRGVTVPASSRLERADDKTSDGGPEFCIDAGSSGNVARFINHSCEPNLFVQCVLSSHHDIRFARVVLFAADNIPALQELTYDYGYELDSVIGSDGKVKQLECHCGADSCRKRLY